MLGWIKHILSDIYHFIKSSEYRLLRRSILFDPSYYLNRYQDVAQLGANPILHYLNFGYQEKRQPSVFFDPLYYESQLSSDIEEKLAPLTHYLTKGYKDHLSPHPLFNPLLYTEQRPNLKNSEVNPYLHFLSQDTHTTVQAGSTPYFDPEFYEDNHPDVKEKGLNPYYHYIKTGIEDRLQPSLWFDTAWYQDRHDLPTNPLTHYLTSGCKKNNSPNPLFDPAFYTKKYRVEDAPDPFLHFMRHGLTCNQSPCSWFDPGFYQEKYLKKRTGTLPLQHFLTTGLAKSCYPNKEIYDLEIKPVISILVPVYNAEPGQLRNCIRSLIYQSYPRWELCLADDCSTDTAIRPLLESWTAKDSRIKSIFLAENSGISKATNMAASLATGDYLGLLDNDDELAPEALSKLVKLIETTGADLLYSDEDLIGTDARQYNIFRKPAFNRELLLSHNYVTHFVLTKRPLFEQVGGCDSRYDGAQDLDLFLKLSEQAKKIAHCPEILYHWRASSSSTSINHSQKDYANKAGKMAIEAALSRNNISASVSYTPLKFYYRVKRNIPDQPTVALIISFESPHTDPVTWLTDLLHLSQSPVDQIVALCAQSDQAEALSEFSKNTKIKTDIICSPGKKVSLARQLNECSKGIASKFLIFLSNRIEIRNSDWIQSLIEYGDFATVGAVGGRISCEDEKQEWVTQIPDLTNNYASYYSRFLTNASILMNGRHCPQEVLSVNVEFFLMKTALFNNVGGFNELSFPHLFAIHDLCYRITQRGLINIFTPYAEAFWKLTDQEHSDPEEEKLLQQQQRDFQLRWRNVLLDGDPYYNRGIVLDAYDSVNEFITWLTGEPAQSTGKSMVLKERVIPSQTRLRSDSVL